MIIIGIDPGINRTGFGVVNTENSSRFVRCGVLTTLPNKPLEDRLVELHQDLSNILQETRPDVAVVEEVFFGANRKTAMSTAQARGVLIHALRSAHISIQSLTPLQIKSRLTGYGTASKEQIQSVVTQQLQLSAIPNPDDAADALAAALSADLTIYSIL